MEGLHITVVRRKVEERDIGLIKLTPDLIPVINIVCFVWVFEDERGV